MSCFAGPEINESGLVLSVDAGNTKSLLNTVEVLVVAGGGGGGMDMGGGGGGGGVIYSSTVSVTPGVAHTVTVGAGGYGAPGGSGGYRTDGAGPQPGGHQFTISATNGGDSVFGSLTAIGGGFGASSYYGYTPNYGYGGTGGSGGGCSGYTHGGERYVDSNGTPGQGYPGGNSGNPASSGDDHYSGGGGGAGGRGTSGPNHIGPNGVRADGGPGVCYPNISPYYFAGGGGGSGYSGNGGYGGIGGGGGGSATNGNIGLADTGGINIGSNGSSGNNAPGGNAGANTGGGGGGGSHYNANNKGGEGGSGIVFVRYPGAQRATGGTVTSSGGYTIHTFTTVGSTTFTPLTWADLSGSGNTATLVNGPTYNSANGGSIVFDGSNDYVPIGTSQFPFGSSAGTLSGWARTNTISAGFGWIVSYGNPGSGQSRFLGILNSTYYFGGFGDDITASGVPLNTWFNMVGVYNGTNASMYINGLLVSGPTAKSWNTVANTAQLGRQTFAGEYWNGNISNVSVYNRALSAAEVAQNYNSNRFRYGL